MPQKAARAPSRRGARADACRCAFAVQGRRLRAPKALLCIRCAHFKALFSSGMRECQEGIVRMGEVDYEAFRAMLQYLLTD